MSIRDDMVQKVLGNPGKYSIEELKNAMQSGALPAYIVVPIIQDKVQQQKQMQASMLLQQPAPKDMPPIAQQVMQEAQMMQAAPGVEGLSSNLPQEYAHGGIVAFEEGGEVERYQTGRLVESEEQRRAREAYRAANPFLRESDELEDDPQARADRKAMVETLRKLRAAGMDIATLPGRGLLGAAETAITRPLRAMGVPIPYLPESVYGGDRSSVTPYSDVLRREETPTGLPTAITRPETDMGGTAPKGVAGLRTGAGAAPAGGIDTLAAVKPYRGPSASDIYRQQIYGTETEPGYLARSTARQAALEQRVKEAEGKVTGKAYEGLEASLRKEAEQFGADKDQARNMAIFKAGLAMMAGTSRHALENIGKGALVGAEDYQKAAADIKKAQKENERMMAQIEQARRAESIGDRDRAIARLDKATEFEERRDQALVNGFTSAGIKDIDRAVEEYKANLISATHIKTTNIAASSREEVAMLRGLMSGAGEKGAMTQKQRGDTLLALENSPNVVAYKKKLTDELGSKAQDTPGFKKAVSEKVLQEYQRLYGDRGAPSAAQVGFTPQQIEYLKQQGIAHYFAGLQ